MQIITDLFPFKLSTFLSSFRSLFLYFRFCNYRNIIFFPLFFLNRKNSDHFIDKSGSFMYVIGKMFPLSVIHIIGKIFPLVKIKIAFFGNMFPVLPWKQT